MIHPTDPDTVFVAASGHEWTDNEERGVFKTTDGGTTWKKVLYVSPRTGAIDLAMDPASPNTLYASTWQRIRRKWSDPRNEPGYGESGIYKSTDGGETWAAINTGLPPAASRGRIGIDVARTRPGTVYAFVDNYEIARKAKEGERDAYGRQRADVIKGAEVYRSDDAGASWRKVSESNAFMERLAGTYGWVFGQIRVDPTDENTIYVMGLGLNVSRDGGKTFQAIGDMHGDHHALWIDPDNPKFLVNGNDGGVVVSYDQGRTWREFLDNLPAVQFFNVSYDMDTPFHVFGSIQDHRQPSGRGRPEPWTRQGSAAGVPERAGWRGQPARHRSAQPECRVLGRLLPQHHPRRSVEARRPRPGPGHQHHAEAGARRRLPARAVAVADRPVRAQPRRRLLRRAVRVPVVEPRRHLGEDQRRSQLQRPEAVRRHSRTRPCSLWPSRRCASACSMRARTTAASTSRRDGGKSWTEITKGLQPKRWISKVVASAFDEGTLYVTQNGKRDDDAAAYVWKSTDFGATWKSIAGNIPMGPVNVIAEDPTDARILYVGTDIGVYVTLDGGSSWNVLGGNLPSTYVHDIVIHPRDRMIVAATHGRGMWVMDAVPVQSARR